MDTDDLPLLLGIAAIGAALYFYSSDAGASVEPDSTTATDDPFSLDMGSFFSDDSSSDTTFDQGDNSAIDTSQPASSLSNSVANWFTSLTTSAPAGNPSALSSQGVSMLQRLEGGFHSTPYPDAGGHSIGYGHFIQPGEQFTSITEPQATQLLLQDAATAQNAVNTYVTVPLSQNEYDALVMFTYNEGAGALRGSTLLRLLNQGDYAGAAAQFPVWNISQGQVNPGLVSRETMQAALFTNGAYA